MAEEKPLATEITRYVSNTDRDIYTVSNIPEEVIAVIFAYVSRSPKGFRENIGTVIQEEELGRERASKFHEKIFDPFFSTKEPGKGTGIGLAIVFGIIQEHNGEITCESNEGTGARFEITLPVYVEESGF